MEHRVADPRILRLIQKWLKAGVMEEGEWSDTKTGTPQGSVITPLTQKVILAVWRRGSAVCGATLKESECCGEW